MVCGAGFCDVAAQEKGRGMIKRVRIGKIELSVDLRPDFWKHGTIIWLGTEFHNGDECGLYKDRIFSFDVTVLNCGFKIMLHTESDYWVGIHL
jgi:hypothetical protein